MQLNVDSSVAAMYSQNAAMAQDILKRFHEDPDYRGRFEADPVKTLRECGVDIDFPEHIELRVKTNTDDTFYVAMPPDPNTDLNDEALEMVAGGSTTSTVACAGTVVTSTAPSTVSTAGTAGSADVF